MATKKTIARADDESKLTPDEVRAEAITRINARLAEAGVTATWTADLSSKTFRAMHTDDPGGREARAVYVKLVAALREARDLVERSPRKDMWTADLREFFAAARANHEVGSWINVAIRDPFEVEGRGPDDWTPRRRLIRCWTTWGVPWRKALTTERNLEIAAALAKAGIDDGPETGPPTLGDLALISLATICDVRRDTGEVFDVLYARELDQIKKEQKRLADEEEEQMRAIGVKAGTATH